MVRLTFLPNDSLFKDTIMWGRTLQNPQSMNNTGSSSSKNRGERPEIALEVGSGREDMSRERKSRGGSNVVGSNREYVWIQFF